MISNNKRLVFVSLLGVLGAATTMHVVFFLSPIWAIQSQETSSSAQELTKPPSRLEKIKELKDRVATRVAELRKKDQEVVGGQIKEIGEDTLVVKSGENTYSIFLTPDTAIASIVNAEKKPQKKSGHALDQFIAV